MFAKSKSNLILILLGVMAAVTMTAMVQVVSAQETRAAQELMLPPEARPGECYARVWVPATYQTEEVQVLTREASSRMEIVPAKFEWVEERVMVKEGYEKLEVIPAVYGWEEETVQVRPQSTDLVPVAAKYEWVSEEVMNRPAHTVWKRGRNPIQRVENGTGEIMCLVEIPATYKTVKRKVVAEGPRADEVDVPSEFKTVRKRVVTTEATVKKITVDPVYETVKVRKLVSPAKEKTIEIPDQHTTVTKRKLVEDGHMEWRVILCETNMESGLVTGIQRSLLKAGHNPGPIDGVIGHETMAALESFQTSKGLAQGGLTLETLEALGVRK